MARRVGSFFQLFPHMSVYALLSVCVCSICALVLEELNRGSYQMDTQIPPTSIMWPQISSSPVCMRLHTQCSHFQSCEMWAGDDLVRGKLKWYHLSVSAEFIKWECNKVLLHFLFGNETTVVLLWLWLTQLVTDSQIFYCHLPVNPNSLFLLWCETHAVISPAGKRPKVPTSCNHRL